MTEGRFRELTSRFEGTTAKNKFGSWEFYSYNVIWNRYTDGRIFRKSKAKCSLTCSEEGCFFIEESTYEILGGRSVYEDEINEALEEFHFKRKPNVSYEQMSLF